VFKGLLKAAGLPLHFHPHSPSGPAAAWEPASDELESLLAVRASRSTTDPAAPATREPAVQPATPTEPDQEVTMTTRPSRPGHHEAPLLTPEHEAEVEASGAAYERERAARMALAARKDREAARAGALTVVQLRITTGQVELATAKVAEMEAEGHPQAGEDGGFFPSAEERRRRLRVLFACGVLEVLG
jgi:hypothetical protein